MSTPTTSERAEFAAFCRNASDRQLAEIIRREDAARRVAFAEIAREEQRRRSVA